MLSGEETIFYLRKAKNGEQKAKEILLEDEINLLIEMNQGECEATAWGCDLTYDYVKINGDYRS